MNLRTPLSQQEIETLLGRPEVKPRNPPPLCPGPVLVAGAAGSIGRMLITHLARAGTEVIALDQNETGLFELGEELREAGLHHRVSCYLEDAAHCYGILRQKPARTILHTAAYKHVPLLESNPRPALRNNLVLSWKLAEAAVACGVERLVMISTDKAVQPISIMGQSKRAAESAIASFDGTSGLRALSLRLPNIIGSSGSVAQIWKTRLQRKQALQITSAKAERSFMSPREAVDAIMWAAASEGAKLYAQRCPEPITMETLAEHATDLWGKHDQPTAEITGLRPGERLREAMWEHDEPLGNPTSHGLQALRSHQPAGDTQRLMRELEQALDTGDDRSARACLQPFLHATAYTGDELPHADTSTGT